MAKASKNKNIDSGVRGTFSGRLYIDKSIFFKRKDVQKAIESLKNSDVIKKQLETAS